MNGPAAKISAQAKLNLHLRVLSRDSTGYHSIETVFHRIDYADELRITLSEDSRRTLDVIGSDAIGRDLGPTESNLAYRAAVAYCERASWPEGFTIELEKRIPVGAGLGGGSADAAAVLRVFDSLARDPIGQPELAAIAATLGADVLFLLSDDVMAPDFKIATADAYRWLDADRASSTVSTSENDVTPFRAAAEMFNSWSAVIANSRNDFIDPVAGRHPRLLGLLTVLERTIPKFCSMTGSGSTLFGVFDGPAGNIEFESAKDATAVRTRTSIEVVQPIRMG
jgi:4-diphosphocytidyl-2-C-methyl-D-erythritol kinase